MSFFNFKDALLHCEDQNLLSAVSETGTPAYVYSAAHIMAQFELLDATLKNTVKQDVVIAYACKANSNQAILKIMANLGAGADIVSGGELLRCIKAGIPAEKIVFSGVSKSRDEIRLALRNNVRQINVESEQELRRIEDIAEELNLKAPVALRLNPDVDAETNNKITTGRAQDKFGMLRSDVERLYKEAANSAHLDIQGIHVHIGSQVLKAEHFRTAFEKLADLALGLKRDGLPIKTLDIGGGLGIVYRDSAENPLNIQEYVNAISEVLGPLDIPLVIEPGRFLTGNAGILLTEVLYIKESAGRKFAVVDAGMNDLIRPALYDAWHTIIPVTESKTDAQPYDIVGPVCETADTFAVQRPMPELKAGDLLAIRSAGAYGAVMSSNYNTRPMPPEILVSGDKFAVIRPRQDIMELIEQDVIPDWL